MLATYFCNYMFIGDKYKIVELKMVINYSNIDLDRDFLQHVGGMEGNLYSVGGNKSCLMGHKSHLVNFEVHPTLLYILWCPGLAR